MKYLLDANSFIQNYKNYYSIEIVPSFNAWLHHDEAIFTIDEVYKEIKAGTDGLETLIEGIRLFKIEDQDRINNISVVTKYILADESKPTDKKNKFLHGADTSLVATALSDPENITVITEETLVGEDSQKVKIPNVCKHFGIKCSNIVQLLRTERVALSKPEHFFKRK